MKILFQNPAPVCKMFKTKRKRENIRINKKKTK